MKNNPRLSQNNFDLLRLLFSGTVCLVHASQLSNFPQLKGIESVLSSAIAVKSFFIVSGFLIFMSFEHSSSFISYIKKRVRRIYPAYFTVIILCAFCLIAISSKNMSSYFSLAWLKYVAVNLLFLNFLQPSLAGVFENNPLSAVNGALWTLKIEVMFYLSVPIFVALFRRFSTLPVLISAYCFSVIYHEIFARIAEHTSSGIYTEISRQLPGQLSYFMAGAFFYVTS